MANKTGPQLDIKSLIWGFLIMPLIKSDILIYEVKENKTNKGGDVT